MALGPDKLLGSLRNGPQETHIEGDNSDLITALDGVTAGAVGTLGKILSLFLHLKFFLQNNQLKSWNLPLMVNVTHLCSHKSSTQ